MLLISALLQDNALVFKAPKNHMYFVENVSFVNSQADDFFIFVFDEMLEDVVDITSRRSPIAVFEAAISGTNFHVTGINHKTKYLTVNKSNANSVNIFVLIYGELIKASRSELLMEWFRKGR